MKKLLSVTLSLTFVLTVFFGSLAFAAAKKAPAKKAPAKKAVTQLYKDGKYTAEYNSYDKFSGYKDSVTVTIKGGKIAACTYEGLNKDGKKKSQDASYESGMKAKVGFGPKEYLVKLPKALLTAQNVDKVDTLTGATTSTDSFKELVKAALNNAKKGTTAKVVVTRPAQ